MAGGENVDRELREYLDGMKAESKADINGLNADLKGMKADIERVHAELKADIERVETALLTEFHKWASPAEARARTHTATLRAIDLEMEVLQRTDAKTRRPVSPLGVVRAGLSQRREVAGEAFRCSPLGRTQG